MSVKKKAVASVSEIVAEIHAHLSEAVPGYVVPGPAPAADLVAFEEAGVALPTEPLEFYRASNGIVLPVEIADLASVLPANEALEETRRANEDADDVAPVVVLEHQDFESDVHAMVVTEELRGQIVRWESVERIFDEDDAEPFTKFLASNLKTLSASLPTPKSIKAAVARIAKAGRSGASLGDHFRKLGQPATILRAVLEQVADAPSWITEYCDNALDRPLRAYSDELPIEFVVATAGRLAFAGTATLLDGYPPLCDTLLAYQYLRDPETTLREGDKLEGRAKDGWLLMRRRMGLVPASAISSELRARLVATPRKYRVRTPKDGEVAESSASGLEALELYFESRDELLAAVRNAPASAATTADMVEVMLGETPTVERVADLFAAIGASVSFAEVPHPTWHRVPLHVLIEAAQKVTDPWCADWFGWACVSHPDATPEQLDALIAQLEMPTDTTLLERLSSRAVEAIKAKPAAA